MSALLDLEQSKAELRAVIASGIFAKAPSLALLLEYVCAKYFEGQAGQIKEYNIAVEALGRPPSFDPRQDSIVRVEAFRLRKRLQQYYENEGAGRPLRIVIPSGQYVPKFLGRHAARSDELEAGNGTAGNEGNGLEAVQTVALLPSPNRESALAPSQPALTPDVVAPRRPVSWIRMAAAVGLPLILTALALSIWFFRSQVVSRNLGAVRTPMAPLAGESDEVRIVCGSSVTRHVDRTGKIWLGDRFFHGGSVFETPNHKILATNDPELFGSRREGNFSYDIPLKPGPYELHLYFAETLFGEENTAGGAESSRVFQISVNDKLVLPSFDVISDAGGSSTADERVFKDVSPAADGMLHVRFAVLTNGAPFLNALEILPGVPGKMRPVRIIARARNYTDRQGRLWGADRYYTRGFAVARPAQVTNTPDPEMFTGERYGNFVYSIPVAEGRYAVTLKLAENWFGPGRPGGGGAGSRVFDVYCNGTALLRNFDLFRTAGAQRAMEKTFHGISRNAQGKIMLSFVPIINYACINAIEVVDETD
jgi:hypothetical protein